MTATITLPSTDPVSPDHKPRSRGLAVVIVAGIAVAALGIGLAVGLGSSSTPTGSGSSALYSYYQSMMGRYATGSSSMMGGVGNGSMMGRYGYTWMMGGSAAPEWMHGGTLPNAMMGTNADPGQVMGRLFADAPGSRVSRSEATRMGDETPAGATVSTSANTITFSGNTAHLVAVASPAGGPDETFRFAGMVNPTISVPTGARVTIEVVNADPGTAHGLVVTSSGSASSWMPMMTSPPAFSGAALWFLGNPTSVGMHTGTISFTADAAGTYQYLCAVPGHAQKGMVGTLIVR
ncbi:MAG TPA: sulfocyanin-like copper-binding protein [Acidimicrobiales bacterium]|nr:sulfocyanin-like copper-binding protein [Acidimicrobiales bacterium]